MARKRTWPGSIASYGPRYENGKKIGFRVVVRAYDGSDGGRMVEIFPDAAQLRRMADAAEEFEEA